MNNPYLIVLSAIFGAIVGSFLNVCIYRIPAGESIVFPLSHCTNCRRPIKPFDNIPIASYIILKGRCRNCNVRISPVYPIVELLTAVASLAVFIKYGLSLQYLSVFVFVCALIVVTFIDLEHQIIPDIITLPGIPIFSLSAIFIMNVRLMDSLLGVLAGGGCLYLIAVAYRLLKKREGMGGGDIKLLAMIGGFLGLQSLIFVLLASSLLGAVIGILIIILKKGGMKYAIPFGPFLSTAAIAYIFFGEFTARFLLIM